MTVGYEFFQDCIEKDWEEKQSYLGKLDTYANYAEKLIGNYAEFVAYAYLDGVKSAKELFKKLGLKAIHAYAIQNDYNDFVFEYDEHEVNQKEG